MTSRTTFGDLAAAVSHHLEAPAQRVPSAARRSPAVAAAETDEFLAVLPRTLKALVRYTADIAAASAETGHDPVSPWDRAAARAHHAARHAYQCLPPEEFIGRAWSHRQMTSSLTRELEAAATAMMAARDLIHTHFHTSADGIRSDRSEWAPVINSAPARKALLSELAGWSRHIVSHGTRLIASPQPGFNLNGGQRRAAAICRWLTALITAVETASTRDPVTRGDRRQLHSIPASMLQPRNLPARAVTLADLNLGIVECSERIRSAAALAVTDAAWSPAISAESFTQAAVHATIISHHCEILQQSLAARAAQLGATRLRTDLLASATATARARQSWLKAARAWYHIKTDAAGELSQAAEETADLATWTGRLAYADPEWTLTSGPAGSHRAPQELAPDQDTFTRTLTAVHQASSTLAALAAADYNQIRTAARSGRLLIPAVQAHASSRTAGSYTRAPTARGNALLAAYRNAGTGSVKATSKIAEIAVQQQASTDQPTGPAGRRPQPSRSQVAAAIALSEPDRPPGPIERILVDLGVTDPELLDRGTTLDKAASQLIAEATDRTAPQRWHTAVTRPGAVTNTTAVTRHVLAADQRGSTAALHASMRTLAISQPQAQPEPLQAEP